MSTNLYKLYVDDTLRLARTLIIKSADSAVALNTGLKEYGLPVDDNDPYSWMYYLNLSGEYHPLNVPMEIESLDTREVVPFTKATLLEHRTTAREYGWGGDYSSALVAKYPAQEALIRGIINPVDIDYAVNAPDNTILYYDSTLVDGNEENLISELQRRINGYFRVYYNRDFTITEDLYLAGMLTLLHYLIPIWLFLIRQNNCRTEFVHSFHIWAYLGSHNYLDDYREFLTTKQALWLYRNIRVLERNAGKQATFKELIQYIMTDRGFPIGDYSLVQRDDTLLEGDLYPTATAVFRPINFIEQQNVTFAERTVREILDREISLGVDNESNIDLAEMRISNKFTRGLMGTVPTKVLESDVTDMSLRQANRLVDTLMNQWISYSTDGLYSTVITVENPFTGLPYTMTTKDALIVFHYCLNRGFGVDLVDVPKLAALDVMRATTPTVSQLASISQAKYIPIELVQYARDRIPAQSRLVSTETFYLHCVAIKKAKDQLRELWSLREHATARGQMEAVCRRLFERRMCTLTPTPITYQQYLTNNGWLDILDLPNSDYFMSLAVALFNTATGSNLFYSKSLSEIQAAMLRLLGQLSSYSIHSIQTINTNTAVVADWAVVRVGDVNGHFLSRIRNARIPIRVTKVRAFFKSRLYYKLTEEGATLSGGVKMKSHVYLDIDLFFRLRGITRSRITGWDHSVGFRKAPAKDITTVVKVRELNGLIEHIYENNGILPEARELDGLTEWIETQATNWGE